ncbi:MAG: HEAT repeat domain-containing protein [Nitrospira sp.]|nr:HEAT repeat domain-containing protein [Nitrospira sp.]
MATVMDLLGIGRPAVEILIEYLEDDDWLIREAAADLLGKIGDVRAVEPLMTRLEKDKDTGVKEYAVKSLGLIGDPRPAQLYIEAIPIRPLRVMAIEALAKIKDVEVLRPYNELFNRLRSDRDGGIVSYSAGLIADKLAAAQLSNRSDGRSRRIMSDAERIAQLITGTAGRQRSAAGPCDGSLGGRWASRLFTTHRSDGG